MHAHRRHQTPGADDRRGTHGVGLLDRARVPGAARLDARVRARGDLADRERSSPRSRDDAFRRAIAPLQEQVRERGLWAAHLPPDLGGQGFGQVKLGLMHEILGTSPFAPVVFGNAAPDSGNSRDPRAGRHRGPEAAVAAPAAGRRPQVGVLDDRAATPPAPTRRCSRPRAVLDGDEWVINGRKWFSSNASVADFLIVMAVTDPDAHKYQRASMLIVPTDTPGVNDPARHPDDGAPVRALRPLRRALRDRSTRTCACPPTRCSARAARAS